MAGYKNETNQIISVMVNGQRKLIYPKQTVYGPDTLGAIAGLRLIKQDKKTVIPKTSPGPTPAKIKTQIVNQNQQSVIASNHEILKDIKSDFSEHITAELKYQQMMKGLNKNPSVTIAILTKNSLNLISDCCNSIIDKVRYKNTTIMICDTGTNDKKVWDYYKQVEKVSKDKGFNFKIVKLNNYHFSKNYNNAILNHVDTDYVLIQNNDTIALNDYISQMMKIGILKKVGSVGARLLYPDMSIQHDGQFIFQASGFHKPGTAGHLNIRLKKNQINKFENKTRLVDGNTAAACLLRTNDFKHIGGFDEKYGDIFQDVDLMVKIPHVLNKFNYCNRNAELIHYDNATRLKTGLSLQKANDMRNDTNYLYNKCQRYHWKKKTPPIVDFSIITMVYNIKDYIQLLDSLRYQIGKHTIEIIGIPNFYNIYDSSYEALNNAIDVSSGKYTILCHDDILFDSSFLNNIKENINDIERKNINWGVLGSAGIFLDRDNTAYYLLDENMKKMSDRNNLDQFPNNEVFSLDELCLIINKKTNLRFSNNRLSGFHFYGVDICTQSLLNGYHNFAINAYCHHKSDGYKNIKSESKYKEYCKQALNFHYYMRELNVDRWRSTTAYGNRKNIVLFAIPDNISKKLNKNCYILQAP